MSTNGTETQATAPVAPPELLADDEWTPAQRRAAARDHYRAERDAGRTISGAELRRRFGLSPRWGLDRVTEVRDEDEPAHPHAASMPPTSDGEVATTDSHADRTVLSTAPSDPHTDQPIEPASPADPHAETGSLTTPRTWLDSTITLVVALVAAAASYGHMLDVALAAGEPLWIARAFPITVDGLVLAALRRGEGGRGGLVLGIAASVAANVLAQFPEQAAALGPVVSAWPPLALYGTHRLLLHRR